MKINQKGFGAVEVLLIVVVISLIGGAGWYVLNKNKSSTQKASEDQTQTAEPQAGACPREPEAGMTYASTTLTAEQSKDVCNHERDTDLLAIVGILESYYAENNHYPSLEEANADGFAKKFTNPEESLKDPAGTSLKFSADPKAGQYAYRPTSEAGEACDNEAAVCQHFELTALLTDGTPLVRKDFLAN